MTRTRIIMWVAVPLLLVGVIAVLLLMARRDALTRENLAKIKIGMTRAQVEVLLGPGRACTRPRSGNQTSHISSDGKILVAGKMLDPDKLERRLWENPSADLWVVLGFHDDKVATYNIHAKPIIEFEE